MPDRVSVFLRRARGRARTRTGSLTPSPTMSLAYVRPRTGGGAIGGGWQVGRSRARGSIDRQDLLDFSVLIDPSRKASMNMDLPQQQFPVTELAKYDDGIIFVARRTDGTELVAFQAKEGDAVIMDRSATVVNDRPYSTRLYAIPAEDGRSVPVSVMITIDGRTMGVLSR